MSRNQKSEIRYQKKRDCRASLAMTNSMNHEEHENHEENQEMHNFMNKTCENLNPIPSTLTPELVETKQISIAERLEARKLIQQVQDQIAQHPDAIFGDSDAAPVKHSFCDGFYIKEIFLPQGFFAVGKIHRHAHPNFLLSGEVTVITEQEGQQRLKAPVSMINEPGTKRMVFAHEDSVWVTVHLNPTNTQDLAELEEMIIAKDYGELPESIIDMKELT